MMEMPAVLEKQGAGKEESHVAIGGSIDETFIRDSSTVGI